MTLPSTVTEDMVPAGTSFAKSADIRSLRSAR